MLNPMNEPENARLQLMQLQTLWLGLEDHQKAAILSVARDITKLGPKACKILSMQASRLAEGSVYGDFEKGRDWMKETREEALDGLNYLCALTLETQETK